MFLVNIISQPHVKYPITYLKLAFFRFRGRSKSKATIECRRFHCYRLMGTLFRKPNQGEGQNQVPDSREILPKIGHLLGHLTRCPRLGPIEIKNYQSIGFQ